MKTRKEKVDKLKAKIIKEIHQELDDLKEYLVYYLTKVMDETEFENTIKSMYALYRLRDYVLDKHSFMQKYSSGCYIIIDESIDIWLYDGFNFASEFVFKLDEYDVNEMHLNDEWFEYDFMSILDRILYREKKGVE